MCSSIISYRYPSVRFVLRTVNLTASGHLIIYVYMCDTHIQSCAKPSLVQIHIFCVQLTEVHRYIFKAFISALISI